MGQNKAVNIERVSPNLLSAVPHLEAQQQKENLKLHNLEIILSSRSWRYTRPFRVFLLFVRRCISLVNKLRNHFNLHFSNTRYSHQFPRWVFAFFKAWTLQVEIVKLSKTGEGNEICGTWGLNLGRRNKNEAQVRLYITQSVQINRLTIFYFCHTWVMNGDNSTLYCDIAENSFGKSFVKPNWDYIYNRTIPLLPPVYMESISYSSLTPKKVKGVNIELKELDFLTLTNREVRPHLRLRKASAGFKVVSPCSFVIPTGNKIVETNEGRRWLIGNLVREISKLEHVARGEIIVVHNGDLNERQRRFLERHKNVKLKEYRDKKLNLSHKINLGVAETKYENVVIANDDIYGLTNESLFQLLFMLNEGNTGVVGPRIFYPDGRLQYAGVSLDHGFPHILGYQFPGDHKGYGFSFVTPRKVDALTGVLQATKKSIFDSVGGWSTELPINFNDIEYCIKVKAKGFDVVYNPQSTIFHLESASRDLNQPFLQDQEKLRRISYKYGIEPIWPNLYSYQITDQEGICFEWRAENLFLQNRN